MHVVLSARERKMSQLGKKGAGTGSYLPAQRTRFLSKLFHLWFFWIQTNNFCYILLLVGLSGSVDSSTEEKTLINCSIVNNWPREFENPYSETSTLIF